jgi:malate dehydrogenase (oxaloacetate-decarboxylating)(NADP+)
MDEDKIVFAQDTPHRTLADVIAGADIFLGLSAAGVLKPEMVAQMAPRPVIFALANPTPEILPEEVHAVRNDAIVATGRTDYPNQINNVLCFPYIFRGALDSGATTITVEMEIAAVHAIAELAQAELSEVVTAAYAGATLSFGPEYLIPTPFDPRLMMRIAPAVAKAAAESGVALAPDHRHGGLPRQAADLRLRVGHGDAADLQPRQGGEEEADRVRRGRGRAHPARGAGGGRREPGAADADRPARGDQAAHRQVRPAPAGRARLRPGQHRERPPLPQLLADVPRDDGAEGRDRAARQDRDAPAPDADRRDAAQDRRGRRHALRHLGRHGDAPQLHRSGDRPARRRQDLRLHEPADPARRQIVLVDTHVNYDPTAEQIAEFTVMAAEEMLRSGIKPKAALLSHSNFGTSNQPSAVKMREALALLQARAAWLEVDGEMHGDTALDGHYRHEIMPTSPLTGEANLLVLPNIDAANISYNLLKTAAGGGIAIGPVLLGAALPVTSSRRRQRFAGSST